MHHVQDPAVVVSSFTYFLHAKYIIIIYTIKYCVCAYTYFLDTQLLWCPLDPHFSIIFSFVITHNTEYYYCWMKMPTATVFVTSFMCLLVDGLVQGRPPNFVVFLADE